GSSPLLGTTCTFRRHPKSSQEVKNPAECGVFCVGMSGGRCLPHCARRYGSHAPASADSKPLQNTPSFAGAEVAIDSAQISLPPFGVGPTRLTAPVDTSTV